ncbi:hypothetical protein V6N11_050959 [Hibiscus sabdariffa]|uniref:Uncharacterized protein n=1 Tax=Hibiscus sabdariffa TaxID=183260 RepID=A0ABR2R2G0_9ROSI
MGNGIGSAFDSGKNSRVAHSKTGCGSIFCNLTIVCIWRRVGTLSFPSFVGYCDLTETKQMFEDGYFEDESVLEECNRMVNGLDLVRLGNVANACKQLNNSGNGYSWVKPLVGWDKANADVPDSLHIEEVACGGVIRDSNGDWCVGFSLSWFGKIHNVGGRIVGSL